MTKKIVMNQGTAEDLFFRGKALAKRLDRHEGIGANDVAATIAFEDIADLPHALTPARLELIRMVKNEPGSITSLAQRLNRDRSAVTRASRHSPRRSLRSAPGAQRPSVMTSVEVAEACRSAASGA